jgi:hypothetical protein
MSDTYTNPTPPPAAPGAEALSPGNASTVSALAKDYTGKMDALTGDMQKNFAAGEAAQAPYREKLLEVLNSPNAAKAHLEKAADAPKPQDYQKYSMEFASAMAVLGALAGRFTRNAGNASLNAFSGALKGWQEGNLQAYETAAKEWEQNTKKTIENNNIELEKYKEIMADKKLNIDQMMSAMNIVAAQYQNKIVFDSTVAKNYTMAFGAVDKMIIGQDKLQKSTDKLTQLRADQRAKIEAQVKTLNENPEMLAQMPIEKYLALKGAAEALGLTLNELPKGATWKAPITPRSAPAIAVAKYIQEGIAAGTPRTAADIQKFQAAQAGESAYARTAGSTAARIENATNEVEALLPQAIETSRALPRGKIVPVNKLVQDWLQGTSDPAYNDFALANFSLVNAYTRAMNPQGVPRITERLEQKAYGILSTATSPEAYEVQAARLWKEVQASKSAVAKTAEGRSAGDINAPMPGAKPADDGWTVKEK